MKAVGVKGHPILRSAITTVTWLISIIFFFPVFWITLISFRAEKDAGTFPPTWVAPFTFENWTSIFQKGAAQYLINSALASVISVSLVLILAYPAAYALFY
jgi:sorbitol/mannitol transport system permease protein